MSHELAQTADGRDAMAYVGRAPWHKLGQKLEAGASKEEWCKAAGFDFQYLVDTVRFEHNGAQHEMPSRLVIYRGDTLAPMSIVSNQFKIVQPSDVMAYFDSLATRAGFQLETAGLLFGGKQLWALANIGDEKAVASAKDRIKGRLLMATSVDLSLPTTLKFLAERVVCHNTLSYGMREGGGTTVRVRHRTTFRPDEVNEQLGITMQSGFDEAMEDFRRLADTPMNDIEMIEATIALHDPSAMDKDPDELMQLLHNHKPIQRIGELSIGEEAIGSELPGAAGTAWGWLNAVTQYYDHERNARSDDFRLSRTWFGDGDRMKSRAFEIAMMTANGDESYKHDFQASGGALLDAVLAAT
jgi:phage/plasmid-like protein (TIGR03299 family)